MQGGAAASSRTSPYPYQDEAEEQILAAVEARVRERIAESKATGGPLGSVGSVLTGDRSDETPRLPLVWLQDAEVRATSGTLHATGYEMDFFIRVEVENTRDSTAGQREARALATRVRDTLIKESAGGQRLGLNFVRHVKPWRSQRMGEIAESVFGHYSAVRVEFMARE